MFSSTKNCYAELKHELVTGCTVRRYKQLETSPEMIEQELRTPTDRLKENFSIDAIQLHYKYIEI